MALAGEPVGDAETVRGVALRKVEAALTWYAAHLTEQPKYDAVAHAIHVSERQLRRLFHQVRQESVHRAFTRVRLNRALELLSETNLKLEEIARRSGFSGAPDFCRVFKAHRKISPDAWRKHQLPAYRLELQRKRK